ncbi:hypothetical protein [Kineococcus vitellinus]|uniref:hypothetical protein n=1 Tax=Kineococcus vitellinus TaxID=2696565 RepID=UPI00196A4B00|nr:hypothetical protein [Kineococcus vitellinus]
MPESTTTLCRRWGHSFEEDHDGITVYRPADYEFPRARGRAGMELRQDGSWTDWSVGRGDAPEPTTGKWLRTGDDLRLANPGGAETALRIVQLAPDRLELRRTPS